MKKVIIMSTIAMSMTALDAMQLPTHYYFINTGSQETQMEYVNEAGTMVKLRIPPKATVAAKVPLPKRIEFEGVGVIWIYAYHFEGQDDTDIRYDSKKNCWEVLTENTFSTGQFPYLKCSSKDQSSPCNVFVVDIRKDQHAYAKLLTMDEARQKYPKAGLPAPASITSIKDISKGGWFFKNDSKYPLTITPQMGGKNGQAVTLEPKKQTTSVVGSAETSTFIINSSVVDAKIELHVSTNANKEKSAECTYVKIDEATNKPNASVKSASLNTVFANANRTHGIFVVDVGTVSPIGGISVKAIAK